MKFWLVVLCWLCCSLGSLAQSTLTMSCNEKRTFCWDGPNSDNSDEASASGDRWVSSDKAEPPLEFVTAIRCIKSLKLCINARNLELLGKRITVVDLFHVSRWGSVEIEATREGRAMDDGCTTDRLLLNKVEQTATLISGPGPKGGTDFCSGRLKLKPKTVAYSLVE